MAGVLLNALSGTESGMPKSARASAGRARQPPGSSTTEERAGLPVLSRGQRATDKIKARNAGILAIAVGVGWTEIGNATLLEKIPQPAAGNQNPRASS
jgi:hypothetical protein